VDEKLVITGRRSYVGFIQVGKADTKLTVDTEEYNRKIPIKFKSND